MNDKSKYEIVAEKIGKLVSEKQIQYGDSFGNSKKILNVLYPNGVNPDQYQTLLTVTRIIDKLFRVANGDQGNESAFQDIAGYALLEVSKNSSCKEIDVSAQTQTPTRTPVNLTFETPTLMMVYLDENGESKMETIRNFKGSINVLMNIEDDIDPEENDESIEELACGGLVSGGGFDHSHSCNYIMPSTWSTNSTSNFQIAPKLDTKKINEKAIKTIVDRTIQEIEYQIQAGRARQ